MDGQEQAIMKLMEAERGGEATPTTPPSSLAEAETPPIGSPMSTPEPKEGEKAAARINIQMAMDLLQQSLPALGSDSEEGAAIMKVVKELTKAFGEREAKSKELVPAEIMQLMQTLPQAGGATPEQRVAASAPAPTAPQPTPPMQ